MACFACFWDFLLNAVSAELPVLTIAGGQLTPGQVVVSDITTRNGILLVGAGNRQTVAMFQPGSNSSDFGEADQHFLVQQPGAGFVLPTTPSAAA